MNKLPASTTLGEARKAGRYGDDQLVHLNRAEVALLEGMSPTGTLTINPQTGEKEAFLPFLAALLPTMFPAIGGSLAAATGISALANPMVLSAIGSGLGTAIETGDIGKGLMAGLGGAALGGLAGNMFGGAAGSAAAEGAKRVGSAAASAAAPAFQTGVSGAMGVPSISPDIALKALPSAAPKAAAGFAMPTMDGVMQAGAAALPGMMLSQPGYEATVDPEQEARRRRAMQPPTVRPRAINIPPPGYRHGIQNEFEFFTPNRGYADGGFVDKLKWISPAASLMAGDGIINFMGLIPALNYNRPGTPESRRADAEKAAQGASMGRNYATGGYVDQPQINGGGGDGWAPPVPAPKPAYDVTGPQINGGPNPGQMPMPMPMRVQPRPMAPRPMGMAAWGGLGQAPRFMPRPRPQTPVAPTGGGSVFQDNWRPAGMGSGGGFLSRFMGQNMGFADGGPVYGPGDGTSDSIPATVDGAEPAALSSGEFVIDAQTVSFLGNGSTEAGVKRLEEMVRRIREAKTGNPERPPSI